MLANQMTLDMRSDWVVAGEVQQRFMQRREPAGGILDYSAQCRQAQVLGGDCYDFMPLADGKLAATIGDASGKGLAAALMISHVQSSLRTAASFLADDAAAAIGVVNRQVHAASMEDRYATLFYGVFDEHTGSLCYVNAGHIPPMVIRRDGSVEWLRTGGAPAGMFPDWNYEQGRVRLRSGDIVAACTDGVVEAINEAGEEWGMAGLQRAVAECQSGTADGIVEAIFQSLDEFTGGRQTDDATVVVLRVP